MMLCFNRVIAATLPSGSGISDIILPCQRGTVGTMGNNNDQVLNFACFLLSYA